MANGNSDISFSGKEWERAIISVEDESDIYAMERLNKEISEEMNEFAEETIPQVSLSFLLAPPIFYICRAGMY